MPVPLPYNIDLSFHFPRFVTIACHGSARQAGDLLILNENSDLVDSVTDKIGDEKTIRVRKTLNEKEDKTYFLSGVHPVHREIIYIPSDRIDKSVINKLRTGDYVGIYFKLKGLDVSHVGIIIKDNDKIYLRHASSQKKHRKAVYQDFKNYISNKPGIIVFRPKDLQKIFGF